MWRFLMKKIRTFRFPIFVLLGALILGVFCSCVSNAPISITGDDSKVEQTDAPEVDGNGAFKYALNEAGYYEITGYVPATVNGIVTAGENAVDVVVPSVIGGIEVTSIGQGAFYYCSYIKSITIPDSVTVIGDLAFAGCKYLETITIPDTVTTLGEGMFANCESLTSVRLPAGMTSIPDHTFSGCASLKEFTITEKMTEIGNGAFRDCASLERVVIHDKVTRIGAQAYYNCSELKYFEINANLDFILLTDEKGNIVYDENGYAVVNDELSDLGAYMLYRFHPDAEIVYDEENNLGMALFYAHYELDKEPPELTTETTAPVTGA